jgi:hypothetical protein
MGKLDADIRRRIRAIIIRHWKLSVPEPFGALVSVDLLQPAPRIAAGGGHRSNRSGLTRA